MVGPESINNNKKDVGIFGASIIVEEREQDRDKKKYCQSNKIDSFSDTFIGEPERIDGNYYEY